MAVRAACDGIGVYRELEGGESEGSSLFLETARNLI